MFQGSYKQLNAAVLWTVGFTAAHPIKGTAKHFSNAMHASFYFIFQHNMKQHTESRVQRSRLKKHHKNGILVVATKTTNDSFSKWATICFIRHRHIPQSRMKNKYLCIQLSESMHHPENRKRHRREGWIQILKKSWLTTPSTPHWPKSVYLPSVSIYCKLFYYITTTKLLHTNYS